MHYEDDINKDHGITLQHLLSILLFIDYKTLAYKFCDNLNHNAIDSLKNAVSEYRNLYKLIRECVELFGNKVSDLNKRSAYYASFGEVDAVIFEEYAAHFNNPLFVTQSISSAIVNAKENGMILALRQNSFCDGMMYFDCSYLSYFGYENTSLLCGGYRPLMITNVRTLTNKINYERFIKPIALLNYFLKQMAVFYIEPKMTDNKMLNVMINERERCPVYVKNLFDAFVDSQKRIKINMRILKKYYGKLLEKMFVATECDKVIAISFVSGLFANCELIEIEMEATMNGNVENVTEVFVKTLLSEMEKFDKLKSKLRKVRIYQIEIAEKYMKQMNESLNAKGWNVRMIAAKNKENKDYVGKSISIQCDED